MIGEESSDGEIFTPPDILDAASALTVMLILCVNHVITKSRSKKYRASSSDETIENLLYFKDCQKKPKVEVTTPEIIPLRVAQPPPPPPPPPQPQCPFPKMCCALTCGNECGATKEPSFMSRQMEPIQRQHHQPIHPMMQSQPRQPVMPGQPQLRKRKKLKFPAMNMQTPINSRRGFGFTKEKIKSLINQDDDIRKILKDLVRVTMQKVDLMEMQNGEGARRSENVPSDRQVNSPPPEATPAKVYDDDEDYFE